MPNISSYSSDCSNLFQQQHPDQETVYLLSLNTNKTDLSPSWKALSNNSSLSNRAFHTATTTNDQIIVLGGAIYTSGRISERINLKGRLSLKLDKDDQLTVAKFELSTFPEDIYISSHATATISAHPSLVYIYGGYHQPVAKTSGQVSLSSTLIIIDVVNKLVLKQVGAETFSTAGHTMTFDEDTLLISGGTKRALTLYTSKPLIPDKCDLRDKCEIDESFVSTTPWVFCEGKCQRWLHQFCIA